MLIWLIGTYSTYFHPMGDGQVAQSQASGSKVKEAKLLVTQTEEGEPKQRRAVVQRRRTVGRLPQDGT